ncbi:hypothetical protein KI387_038808, partial [Taxus chinensis]
MKHVWNAVIMAMPNNPSRMQIIPLLLAFIRSLLNAHLCTALFTRSGGGEGALSPQDGAAFAVALSNLMTPNKISTSKLNPTHLN